MAIPARKAATLWAACRSRLVRAMSYRIVVRASACRIAYCMSRSGTPLIRPAVQNVRRNECGLAGLLTSAAAEYSRTNCKVISNTRH